MGNNNFIFGFIAGAVTVIAVIALIKQLSRGGSLLELRRDNNGNIIEILEHGL